MEPVIRFCDKSRFLIKRRIQDKVILVVIIGTRVRYSYGNTLCIARYTLAVDEDSDKRQCYS